MKKNVKDWIGTHSVAFKMRVIVMYMSNSRPADPKDPSLEQSSVISMAIMYTMMTKLISF